jgi:hypothetical protein
MDKTNFFLKTLLFSPWEVSATWLHVEAPQNNKGKMNLIPKGQREPKRLFALLTGYHKCLKLLELLKLLEGVGMHGSFPMRRSM